MSAGLASLQEAFQARLLTGGGDLPAHLTGGGPFVSVYDHAYGARLREVLGEDFPALGALLGEDEFEKMATAYLAAHPSRRRSIRWIGESLAGWLAATAPWSDHLVLADMAAFEWALGLAFDAPDAPLLGFDDLAALAPEDWPGLRLVFHPAFNPVDLGFDVAAFHQAVDSGGEPEDAPQPFAEPVSWAVWRDPETLVVRHRRLADLERDLLAAARAGADFSALCDLAARHAGDDAALQAAGLLRLWVESGWLSVPSPAP